MNPSEADNAEARALAVRIAGRNGADRLLKQAREQVAAIVAEPAFREDVERLADELLRHRQLDAAAIETALTKET